MRPCAQMKIPLVVTVMVVYLGSCAALHHQPKVKSPVEYAQLPIVNNFKAIWKMGGTNVRLHGEYHPFDLDVENLKAFKGQALVRLADGREVILGTTWEERLRPTVEIEQFKFRQVEVVGTVFPSIPGNEGGATLAISAIGKIQYLGLRE
jgi:hypothetical protein